MADWQVPWFPGALIEKLAADAAFMTACGGRVSSRAGVDVSQPYATVQVITSPPISDVRAAWRPTLQLVGWCPPGATSDDPALVAWRMAATGIRAVLMAPRWGYDGWHGSFRVLLGPVEDVDTTRGLDAPVYGARVHIECSAKFGPA